MIPKLACHCAGSRIGFPWRSALKFGKKSILMLALVSFAGTVAAQTPHPTARFALEFPGPNKDGLPHNYAVVFDSCAKAAYQVAVFTCSSLFYDSSLHRLPGFSASASQPSALLLVYKPIDDGVFITATVFYGNFDIQDRQASLEKLPRKQVGPYFAKLNGSFTLSGLAKVGLEPITFRVVSARAENPWRPILRSDAPSLQIDYTQRYRSLGTVTIHNFSNKAVAGLQLSISDAQNGKEMPAERIGPNIRSKPLIAPGGTYRTPFSAPVRGKLVHGAYLAHPPYRVLILSSVLFEDGSYEGDKQTAEGMAAWRIGFRVQMQRVLSLAKPILADGRTDDAAKIRAIRAALSQLSEEPDAQMIFSLRPKFGPLAPAAGAYIRRQLSAGMQDPKQIVEQSIRQYQNKILDRHIHLSFARWWALSGFKRYN